LAVVEFPALLERGARSGRDCVNANGCRAHV
jgi:hypothetical protein